MDPRPRISAAVGARGKENGVPFLMPARAPRGQLQVSLTTSTQHAQPPFCCLSFIREFCDFVPQANHEA